MALAFTTQLSDRIRADLAAFDPLAIVNDGALPSAVGIVLLADTQGNACFVLTRRLMTLRRHGGQFALPGGRLEPGETAEEAALREIQEEIGIQLEHEDVLGRLDDYPTRSGHLITPFVIWSPTTQQPRANPAEVQAAYVVPLADLDRQENIHFEPLLHLSIAQTSIHAPTAAMLYQFREVALHGRAVRVADVEQPFFAWR